MVRTFDIRQDQAGEAGPAPEVNDAQFFFGSTVKSVMESRT
jgi:hypothetical protein